MRLIRVIAAISMAALVVTACSGAASSPAPATAAPATAAPATAAPVSAAPTSGGGGGNAVTIQNFAFNPATLTATGAVTWTNLDDQAHSVVFDDTSIEPSENITKGGPPFTGTFPGPGSYPYKCGIHPTMKGTVTIT